MTQAEYARQRNRSKPLICRAVKFGQIVLVDGKVDEFQADEALGYSRDGSGKKINKVDEKGEGGSGKGYWKEKARREAAEASLKEMDLAQRRQELVEVEVVILEFSKLVDAVRQQLLSLPTKIAPTVLSAKTTSQAHRLIEQAIHEALNDFGTYNAKTGKPRAPGAPKKNRVAGKKAKAHSKVKGKRVGK